MVRSIGLGLLVFDRNARRARAGGRRSCSRAPRDLVLQLLDLVGLELDHLARAQVDQMVVVLVRHLLVARAAVAEIVPLDDAGVLEQPDRAIDRRNRDLVVDRDRARVEFLDVGMVLRAPEARARSRGAARSCASPWRCMPLRWSSALRRSRYSSFARPGGPYFRVATRGVHLAQVRSCSNQVAAQDARAAAPAGLA